MYTTLLVVHCICITSAVYRSRYAYSINQTLCYWVLSLDTMLLGSHSIEVVGERHSGLVVLHPSQHPHGVHRLLRGVAGVTVGDSTTRQLPAQVCDTVT